MVKQHKQVPTTVKRLFLISLALIILWIVYGLILQSITAFRFKEINHIEFSTTSENDYTESLNEQELNAYKFRGGVIVLEKRGISNYYIYSVNNPTKRKNITANSVIVKEDAIYYSSYNNSKDGTTNYFVLEDLQSEAKKLNVTPIGFFEDSSLPPQMNDVVYSYKYSSPKILGVVLNQSPYVNPKRTYTIITNCYLVNKSNYEQLVLSYPKVILNEGVYPNGKNYTLYQSEINRFFCSNNELVWINAIDGNSNVSVTKLKKVGSLLNKAEELKYNSNWPLKQSQFLDVKFSDAYYLNNTDLVIDLNIYRYGLFLSNTYEAIESIPLDIRNTTIKSEARIENIDSKNHTQDIDLDEVRIGFSKLYKSNLENGMYFPYLTKYYSHPKSYTYTPKTVIMDNKIYMFSPYRYYVNNGTMYGYYLHVVDR